MDFYFAENGRQVGPLSVEQLRTKGIGRETLVWREGMTQWTPAGSMPELASLFTAPAQTASPTYETPTGTATYGGAPYVNPGLPPHVAYSQVPPGGADKKVAAGLCGILIGGLGIHKFVLGYTGAGMTMLLVTVLTCGFGGMVMGVIGLIEGIIYLTKTDEAFYREYVLQQKAWF